MIAKYGYLLIFCFLPFLSCKKAIDKKKENIVMDAITNGVWVVQLYMEGSNDISSSFAGYEFQFYNNGTVEARQGGTTSSGTWSGNIDNYSITASFGQAAAPLPKLNATWMITDSYWDYVEAESGSTQKNQLHLIKK